jgi:hypothetical protein
MEMTIKFLMTIQNKSCCHMSEWRNEKLEIEKIDDVDVDVRLLYNVKHKNYELKIWTNDDIDLRRNCLFYKKYNNLSECYTLINFANELKEDFTKIRFSKLEDKFHIEPITENLITVASKFLCSDNSLILTKNIINECGVCFEKTKRKIDCCNGIVCYPCQLKIPRKTYLAEDFEGSEATPCPFCRRVIDTKYIFENYESEEEEEEE